MAGQPSHISVSQGTRELLSDLSLLNEKTYPEFIERYPNLLRDNYIVKSEAQGAGVYTANNRFFHWTQKGKSIPMFKHTGTTVAAAADATGTITIDAAYHIDGNTAPGIGHYYMNDTNGELYQVVSKSTASPTAHTVGLKNAVSGGGVNVASTHALIYKPTIVGEASGTQAGIYRIDEKIENECATIKTSQKFTDWNLFEKLDMPGFEGKFKFRQQAAEREKFIYDQEQLLMFIDSITGVSGVTDNHRALIPLVKEFGQVDTSSTAINQAFFDNLARLIDVEGYSYEYDALMNINFRLKYEAFLRTTYGAGGGIVWAKAYEDGPMKINDHFGAFTINGIKLNATTYKHFSSSAIAGAAVNTGYYNNACLLIPQGFGVQPDGTNVPRFRVRWQGESAAESPIKIRQTGGLAKPATDDTEHLIISHVTRKGVDPFGLNGYMWLQPNFS